VGLTGFLLVATVWISAGIFGLYIVAFYGRNYLHGTMENWNGYALPNLYEKAYPLATAGVALHFLAVGTYHSTRFLWGPVILEMFGF
jgi:hypothetical protein